MAFLTTGHRAEPLIIFSSYGSVPGPWSTYFGSYRRSPNLFELPIAAPLSSVSQNISSIHVRSIEDSAENHEML